MRPDRDRLGPDPQLATFGPCTGAEEGFALFDSTWPCGCRGIASVIEVRSLSRVCAGHAAWNASKQEIGS